MLAEKENHFLKCFPEVTVMTDCREMISTHAKPLETIENRRVQKMLMDIAHLNLKIVHIPGIMNCTGDFCSRRPRTYLKLSVNEKCHSS